MEARKRAVTLLDCEAQERVVHKAGERGFVLQVGQVRPGDPVGVQLPDPSHKALEPA